MSPRILLATNKRDITTDFIVIELRRRGLDFVRLNTEDITRLKVRFTPRDGWRYDFKERSLEISSVSAGYYRRPHPPLPDKASGDSAADDYAVEEWSAVLRSLWNALDGRWLNCPFSILRAEDKPRQLALACSVGLNVPCTLITNDIGPASEMSAARPCIGKPLRCALIERGDLGSVLFTQRIGNLTRTDAEALEVAPIILQEEIKKRRDIRATVVGERVFAVAIDSQTTEETEIDWRRGSRPDLPHIPIDLVPDVASKLVELTRRLGLSYGAADLIEDRDGRLWFLEMNPNGQWAWIERRTGLPIASAIVDILEACH